MSRRDFLRKLGKTGGASAVLATFPPSIQKALALPANQRTRSLQDVEHIVVLTQENRSFDHYFGTLEGVRGFGDPFPVPVMDRQNLINRKSVFVQRTAGSAPVPGRPAWPQGRAIAPPLAYMFGESQPIILLVQLTYAHGCLALLCVL